MMKFLVLSVSLLILSACQARDAHYYRLNPQALQQAIKTCPARAPGKVSCTELREAAEQVNHLAYELQMNPQRFGSKIIALQEELARQQARLAQAPKEEKLLTNIKQNQKELEQRLAIVRWLESP